MKVVDPELEAFCEEIEALSLSATYNFNVNPPSRFAAYLEQLIIFKSIKSAMNARYLILMFIQANMNNAITGNKKGKTLRNKIKQLDLHVISVYGITSFSGDW